MAASSIRKGNDYIENQSVASIEFTKFFKWSKNQQDGEGRAAVPSYDPRVTHRSGTLAVVSPLFINHMSTTDEDLEEESTSLSSFLPLLLLVLIVAVSISGFVDKGLTTFDPHWIHRFGGSSIGILTTLFLSLALVLKCKALAAQETTTLAFVTSHLVSSAIGE
ncbi:hypothetical protein Leryth_009097 [Lithospermum erythrorhizon]|nr:hypothetical protein Leryth_009097 [Lithospermum erythrorhizon]